MKPIGPYSHIAKAGSFIAISGTAGDILVSVGFKLGRWVDSVFMQRALRAGDTTKP